MYNQESDFISFFTLFHSCNNLDLSFLKCSLNGLVVLNNELQLNTLRLLDNCCFTRAKIKACMQYHKLMLLKLINCTQNRIRNV